jgi:phenylacetate-coenzyme A ligase PaaK-like adenylate-forming protein
LPLILRVEGRTDDILWIKDGGKDRPIHPYVLVDVLDECPECGWYQFEQTEPNRLVLRAAPAPGRTVTVEQLRRLVDEGLRRFNLAELLKIDVEVKPDIAPDQKTGKLRRIKGLAKRS